MIMIVSSSGVVMHRVEPPPNIALPIRHVDGALALERFNDARYHNALVELAADQGKSVRFSDATIFVMALGVEASRKYWNDFGDLYRIKFFDRLRSPASSLSPDKLKTTSSGVVYLPLTLADLFREICACKQAILFVNAGYLSPMKYEPIPDFEAEFEVRALRELFFLLKRERPDIPLVVSTWLPVQAVTNLFPQADRIVSRCSREEEDLHRAVMEGNWPGAYRTPPKLDRPYEK